jgi:hypothetical protein
MMASMELISLTLLGLLSFLLLHPLLLLLWVPLLLPMVPHLLLLLSVHVLLLLVGMHLQLLLSLLELLLIGGKKQNIFVKGLKTLISMCHSNDALICESHQQMSQRLSHLEECQCEMCTSMSFETPESTVYPPLPPLAVEDPWAWYRNTDDDGEDTMMMRARRSPSEDDAFPSLFFGV